MPKSLPLRGGQLVALVDDADWERLSAYRWHAIPGRGKVYAARSDGRGRKIRLHREVTQAPAGMVVDHIDGDPLNNTRANLRVCTQGQNVKNRCKTQRPTTSHFKGVNLHSPAVNGPNPWRASIRIEGRVKHLGLYPSQDAAARAYDRAAREHHGEYARLNFPGGAAHA
jgi:hypothetical protein